MFSQRILLLGALSLSAASVGAQPRSPQPPARRFRDPSATDLLDRRRELDLTPRQVARLDSIERAQVNRGRAAADQLTKLRDSTCGARQTCTDDQRRNLRERMSQLRGTAMDTSARRMAMSLLDSTQRGRVQGWQMGRGRAGMAMAPRGMQRGFGNRGGMSPRARDGRDRELGDARMGRRGFAPRDRFSPRMREDDRPQRPAQPRRPRRPDEDARSPEPRALPDTVR